jgi:hypothetical protein
MGLATLSNPFHGAEVPHIGAKAPQDLIKSESDMPQFLNFWCRGRFSGANMSHLVRFRRHFVICEMKDGIFENAM